MIRRPPGSTLFPTRRSSDLLGPAGDGRPWPLRPESQEALLGLGLFVAVTALAASRRRAHRSRRRPVLDAECTDRKSTRPNSRHANNSHAGLCFKKKKDVVAQ